MHLVFICRFAVMRYLDFLIKPIARRQNRKTKNIHLLGVVNQLDTLSYLIKNSKNTSFGKDHNFDQIDEYYDFIGQVEIQDYEAIKPYILRARNGEKNVLWKGRPIYFAKTSGTTSGSKYIPITKDSIGHHIKAARNCLFAYVNETGITDFFSKKMIFLQGSPSLAEENGINIGRLSGIVYHHVPSWLLGNRLPSFATNCIEDWDGKLNAIVEETAREKMSLLSGIPPWCIMYFEQLLKKTGAENLKTIYPDLQLYVHGGVNYKPYQNKISALLGAGVDTIETYPASEGFFAYQDSQKEEGLLLNLEAGIFYEFVKSEEIYNKQANRVHLGDIELGVDYVLIVSTNAGLWAYNTGDTVRFVSANPFRIIVTGRIKHFISAFGEHVIQEEVEAAISQASGEMGVKYTEFTVAPIVASDGGESCHEWFIELENARDVNLSLYARKLDELVQSRNSYYRDLRQGALLGQIKLTLIEAGGFALYFAENDKVGGQNKVQHLANNRELADKLLKYVKKG